MTGYAENDPSFLTAPGDVDGVLRIALEVASEVWVLRDRFAVLEHLLDEQGTVSREDLDTYQPTGELAAQLARERQAFLDRLAAAGAPHDSVLGEVEA